jgi:dTMP kinase
MDQHELINSVKTKPSAFITFEGMDGAGKSTHIDYVASVFRDQGYGVVVTREPGGTPLGEKLRELLLHDKMNLETEALLMFAARREHLEQVIWPALKLGQIVICDRFTDSSFAYQGGGRSLSLAKLGELEYWVHPRFQPDLTFLFDLPPEVAQARISGNRELDKFESERGEFFTRVRQEYLRRASISPMRFRLIDATASIEDIRGNISQILTSFARSALRPKSWINPLEAGL